MATTERLSIKAFRLTSLALLALAAVLLLSFGRAPDVRASNNPPPSSGNQNGTQGSPSGVAQCLLPGQPCTTTNPAPGICLGSQCPPLPPYSFTIDGETDHTISMGWMDSGNHQESGIHLQRRLPGGTWTAIKDPDPPANATPGKDAPMTYTDTGVGVSPKGLKSNTKYCYRAINWNQYGDSPSAEACASTLLDPPAAPTAVSAVSVGIKIDTVGLEIEVTWHLNDDTADHLFLYRNNNTAPIGTWIKGVNGADFSCCPNVDFGDGQLSPNTQYCYYLKAANVAGSSPASDTVCATTPASAPNGNNGNPGTPKLVVQSVSVGGDGTDGAFPKEGEPFTVHFVVCNAGSADITKAYTDEIQVTADNNDVNPKSKDKAVSPPIKVGPAGCYEDQAEFDQGLTDLPGADQYHIYLYPDVNHDIQPAGTITPGYESIWVDGP